MDSYLQILPIYRYADMEKLYLLSADIYRQAYLQILLADIIIGRTLPLTAFLLIPALPRIHKSCRDRIWGAFRILAAFHLLKLGLKFEMRPKCGLGVTDESEAQFSVTIL